MKLNLISLGKIVNTTARNLTMLLNFFKNNVLFYIFCQQEHLNTHDLLEYKCTCYLKCSSQMMAIIFTACSMQHIVPWAPVITLLGSLHLATIITLQQNMRESRYHFTDVKERHTQCDGLFCFFTKCIFF